MPPAVKDDNHFDDDLPTEEEEDDDHGDLSPGGPAVTLFPKAVNNVAV